MHPTFQMITFLLLFCFHFELICMVLVLYGPEKSEGHAGAISQAKILWILHELYDTVSSLPEKNSFEENMTKYHLYILYLLVQMGIFQVVMMLYSKKY